jgi:hypothetical protein
VFFDATESTGLSNGNDYVGASWKWNFDSTGVNSGGEPHRTSIGFLTAHTYDTTGTYTVAVSMKDLSGATASTVVSITVSAMSGNTYFVSSNGSGTSCSMASPCSLTTGLNHVDKNNAVLLRRGDTFTVTSSLSFRTTGPFVFGSYSEPGSTATGAPTLQMNVGSNWMGDVNDSSDVRITDLHFVAGSGVTQGWQVVGATNALFERVEQEQVGEPSAGGNNFLVEDVSNLTFFVDTHLHDFAGLGIYGDRSKHVAVVGATLDRYSGADHGIRIQGGNPTDGAGSARSTFIGYSTFIPLVGGGAFDCFALRGDNSDSVAVGNYCTKTMSATPQNSEKTEHVSNVLFDSNVTEIKDTDTNTGIAIIAQHVYARNNIIVGADVAFDVSGQAQLPSGYVDQIYIYNNTFYGQGAFAGTGTHQVRFLTHGSSAPTTGNVTIADNIFDCLSTATNSTLFEEDGSGNSTIDHNLWWAPKATLSAPNEGMNAVHGDPLFESTTVTDAHAFWLQSQSAARGAGVSTATWADRVGSARPQGVGWDLGAVAYVDPSAAAGN